MITGVIYNLLSNNEDVSGLTGGRIFHRVADENTRDSHIIISKLSEERPRDFDGSSTYATGHALLHVYAKTVSDLKAIGKAIFATIDNYSGPLAGINVEYLLLDDERDTDAPPTDGKGKPMVGTELQYAYLITFEPDA